MKLHRYYFCRHYSKFYAVALTVMVLLAGCAKQIPFKPKSAERPAPVHCFDAVGHMPGTKPFIFGGTCCCTPTPELMEQYHRDGFLKDMNYDQLIKEYEDRGIQFESISHHDCNNLCEHGPHLVKGGKCMASPTPGTINYEEIRFGIRYMNTKAAEQLQKAKEKAAKSNKK